MITPHLIRFPLLITAIPSRSCPILIAAIWSRSFHTLIAAISLRSVSFGHDYSIVIISCFDWRPFHRDCFLLWSLPIHWDHFLFSSLPVHSDHSHFSHDHSMGIISCFDRRPFHRDSFLLWPFHCDHFLFIHGQFKAIIPCRPIWPVPISAIWETPEFFVTCYRRRSRGRRRRVSTTASAGSSTTTRSG